MKVTVDLTRCQDHGQCAIAAPDVFRINDEGRLEYDGEPADDRRDDVEEAADVCPVQAILVED
ncbi:ferredoxin [Nocardioides sp.]|uniref:ferredoxin n=1 Tax=Nocardioides sp. TaxID=35761 RepID=UPI003529A691